MSQLSEVFVSRWQCFRRLPEGFWTQRSLASCFRSCSMWLPQLTLFQVNKIWTQPVGHLHLDLAFHTSIFIVYLSTYKKQCWLLVKEDMNCLNWLFPASGLQHYLSSDTFNLPLTFDLFFQQKQNSPGVQHVLNTTILVHLDLLQFSLKLFLMLFLYKSTSTEQGHDIRCQATSIHHNWFLYGPT